MLIVDNACELINNVWQRGAVTEVEGSDTFVSSSLKLTHNRLSDRKTKISDAN